MPAETINGEVFVVHGGVAAVLGPPRVRSVFRASGTPDGMWTLDSVHAALGPAFGDTAPAAGFLREDTLELAPETVGFPGRTGYVITYTPPASQALPAPPVGPDPRRRPPGNSMDGASMSLGQHACSIHVV